MKTKNTNTGKKEILATNVNLLKQLSPKIEKVLKTKEQISEHRRLNPQFSHVISKQKKVNELEFKKDAKKVFIATKNIVSTIEEKSYNIFENANLIDKCKQFINFTTKTNKENEIININLFNGIINNVRKTKTGLYNEFYFAQLVQKIVTLSINKGYDFETSLNIILETKRQDKK